MAHSGKQEKICYLWHESSLMIFSYTASTLQLFICNTYLNAKNALIGFILKTSFKAVGGSVVVWNSDQHNVYFKCITFSL